MKVVIVGAGSISCQLAKQLILQGKDVTILEKDPLVIRYVSERLDCKIIQTSGTDVAGLMAADIHDAEFFVALTTSDEVNLASAYIVGAEFPKIKKIVHIRNLEYKSLDVIERSIVGETQLVHPPYETAEAIIRAIKNGVMGEIYEFANREIQLRSYLIDRSNRSVVGKEIKELRQNLEHPFLVPLIRRNSHVFIPTAETGIKSGDTIYILAEASIFKELTVKLDMEVYEGKRVVILGGGEIAINIGQILNTNGTQNTNKGWFHNLKNWISRRVNLDPYQITYVEQDFRRCKYIKEKLPQAEVINANISEEDLFDEENLTAADIFIAATETQELNMVTSLYAKHAGIPRAIVLVHTQEMYRVASSLGLDVIVSTSNTMVNLIFRCIHGRNVHNIHSLITEGMEIIELDISPASTVRDKKLNQIKMPEDTILTYIYREDRSLLPNGNTVLLPNDRIIIITKKQYVEKLRILFTGPLPDPTKEPLSGTAESAKP